MKTEIIHSYIPRDGYFIDSVLPLTENKTAIFTSKYKEASFLDILNLDILVLSIDLSKIPNFDTSSHYNHYLNLGRKFGLVHKVDELLLFDIDNPNNCEFVKISNPFKEDEHGRKQNVERASVFLIDNKILLGLSSFFHYGFPPRYLAYLEISKSRKLLAFGRQETIVKWHNLFELPKKYFPETEFGKFNDDSDWLNIQALTQIENNILVHTTGGANTRLKSGSDFEFNIIAKFDRKFSWIENFEIENGYGKFSTDKKHFIQHPSKHRNKLFFYDTNNMKIDFDISLTAKQNLGQEKAVQIQGDKFNDTLFIYNHRFLNICK